MNSWNCVYDSGVFALVLGQQQHIKYARYQQDHHIEWLSQNENLHDISNVLHVTDFSPLFAISFVIHGSLSLRVCVCVCWLTHVNVYQAHLQLQSLFALLCILDVEIHPEFRSFQHTHTQTAVAQWPIPAASTPIPIEFSSNVLHTHPRGIYFTLLTNSAW